MKSNTAIIGILAALTGTHALTAAVTNTSVTRPRFVMPLTAAKAPALMTTMVVSNVGPATRAKLNPAALSVFVKDGDEWKRQAVGVSADSQRITANVPKGTAAVLTTPQTNRVLLSKASKPLNFWLPTDTGQGDEFEVESYADPEPARWNRTSNEFETEVYLAIFRTNRNGRAKLPAPVTVNVAGRDAVVTPKSLTFTSVAAYEKVRVSFERNDVEARINVFPFTEDAPLVVPVRRLGGLDVRVSPKSILGFGLGVATVTIKRIDTVTNELAEGPELKVDVETLAARTSTSVAIPAGEARSVIDVRSSGIRKESVKVSVGSHVREVELEYRSPWLFIAAVMLGGLVGGCARCLQQRNRKENQLARFLAEGCIAGVLAMAAVLAGVAFSLVPAAVAETELGAFLISAAVALVGISVISGLKKLVPKVGQS